MIVIFSCLNWLFDGFIRCSKHSFESPVQVVMIASGNTCRFFKYPILPDTEGVLLDLDSGTGKVTELIVMLMKPVCHHLKMLIC